MVLELVMLVLVIIKQVAALGAFLSVGWHGALRTIFAMMLVAGSLDIDGVESAVQAITSGLSIHPLICNVHKSSRTQGRVTLPHLRYLRYTLA